MTLPVQIIFSPLVILPSFISRFALVRLQINSITTGWLRKIWTGCKQNIHTRATHPNFIQPFGRIALVFQSVCSCTRADWLYYDWIVDKCSEGTLTARDRRFICQTRFRRWVCLSLHATCFFLSRCCMVFITDTSFIYPVQSFLSHPVV